MDREKAIQYAMYLENKYRHAQTRNLIGSLVAAVILVSGTIAFFGMSEMLGLHTDDDSFNGFLLAILVVAVGIIVRGIFSALQAGRKAEKFASKIYRSVR
ncbi:MAG: hypothetical protein QY314_01545 [Candidatus Dojkabacteria bacterium]|nr:MAG: hypothetical protein QY314_01545 [Candidatus Dojkabacteria bacterium]